jgi:hypothetical protein
VIVQTPPIWAAVKSTSSPACTSDARPSFILYSSTREEAHLTVNETKSAVASVFGRKFLGYGFFQMQGTVKRSHLMAMNLRKRGTFRLWWGDQARTAFSAKSSERMRHCE